MTNSSFYSKEPRVSFVIPMLNEVDAIEKCIYSILEQDYSADKIEIIVADGFSSDGSREKVLALSKKYGNIHLVDNPFKRTPAALNIGIKHSTGQVVVILGAHTTIKNDFVKYNVKYMQELSVRCVGGTQINVGKNRIQQAIGNAMASVFGIPSAPYRFSKKKNYVDTVVYAAYDRNLFNEIGYFDEKLHISEDAELNWRIRKAGYKIFYTPEIVSYYYPRENIFQLAKQFFNYGILRANVMKKHFTAFKFIHILPPVFVFLSLFFSILGFYNPFFLKLLLVLWIVYTIYLFIASLVTLAKDRIIKYAFFYPVIFLTMHICWGSGFIVGLFKTYKK